MKHVILTFCVALFFEMAAHGQGFVNLDFEAARVIPVSTNAYGAVNIAVTNALPGWAAFSGSNPLSTIPYNSPVSGPAPDVGLIGGNTNAIQGNFSVQLVGGSISQSGVIPSNAESLLFDTMFGTPSTIELFLNGQDWSYMAVSNLVSYGGYTYTVYGADVSSFVGQVVKLEFSSGMGGGVLDDIRFSSAPVPEPGVFSLVCFGGGVLVYVIRRRHR